MKLNTSSSMPEDAMGARLILRVIAVLLVISGVLPPSIAAGASPHPTRLDCETWRQRVISLQGGAIRDINAGDNASAIPRLRQATALTTTCGFDAGNGDNVSLAVLSYQLLTAALLRTRDFGGAGDAAAAGFRRGLPILSDDQTAAIHSILARRYETAFGIYRDNIEYWIVDPSVTDDPRWTALNDGLRLGSSGRYSDASRRLASAATPGYRETLYFYGVGLLAAGKACKAYAQFRTVLTDFYNSPNPFVAQTNWVSISALDVLDKIYLDHAADAAMKELLASC